MILYYATGACSLASRIIINELGLNVDFQKVDLKTKKLDSGEDYLKINPHGMVPALKLDDGSIITESSIILQYISDVNKAATVLPEIGNFKRYKVLEALNFISTEIHKRLGLLFSPEISNEVREMFTKSAIAKFESIDNTIKSKSFLECGTFTIADAYLFVMLSWLPHLKMKLSDFPNLETYFKHLSEKPSIQKSLKQEGLI